ncbi:hypothetical protein CFP56_040953 [Quercus suber]|uniref:Uncharacterized protein n=1 Tax=Quercus suber TaxID=58331 RepID=A0AAW0IVV6_QUESU
MKNSLAFGLDNKKTIVTLMAPDRLEAWSPKTSKQEWLVFISIKENVIARGWSYIRQIREMAIIFASSSALKLRGLQPQVSFWSQNVHFEWDIKESPVDSPNTNRIHLEETNNHWQSWYREISRLYFKLHTVRYSIIKHSTNGVQIKTWQGGPGCVQISNLPTHSHGHCSKPNYLNQCYHLGKKFANHTYVLTVFDTWKIGHGSKPNYLNHYCLTEKFPNHTSVHIWYE